MKDWKVLLSICLMVCALLWGAYYLGGKMKARDIALMPKDTVTTVVVAPHVFPPAVLTPNPAPVSIRLVVDRKITDSLISSCGEKDSLIASLMSTKGTEQRFMSKDPTGLDISGDLTVMFSPLEDHFLTQITLDTVKVPERVVYITTPPIIETRIGWGWIAGSLGVGVIIGALVTQ
jgi:hypothetical protein